MIQRFRKLPVVIEAVRYDGTRESFDEIWNWMDGDDDDSPMLGYSGPDEDHPESFDIRTTEGRMRSEPGSWVIKGVKGEFYPCSDEIFRMTYEAVE